MNRRLMIIAGSLAGIAILAVGAFALWFLVLRDDGPEEVSTAGALEALERSNATATAPATQPSGTQASATGTSAPATATTSSGGGSTAGLDGNWQVDTNLQTFVGYRVQEQLVGIGGAEAVGRTSKVTVSVTIAGNSASAGTITADMTALKSNESARDGQLRSQGIEYSKYPTSVFALTSPANLPDGLASGDTVSTTLNGTLTLHGVSKEVEVPVEVTLKDGVLVVVGQIEIQFADYNISKPQGQRVLGMDDHGVMELQLFLRKA